MHTCAASILISISHAYARVYFVMCMSLYIDKDVGLFMQIFKLDDQSHYDWPTCDVTIL